MSTAKSTKKPQNFRFCGFLIYLSRTTTCTAAIRSQLPMDRYFSLGDKQAVPGIDHAQFGDFAVIGALCLILLRHSCLDTGLMQHTLDYVGTPVKHITLYNFFTDYDFLLADTAGSIFVEKRILHSYAGLQNSLLFATGLLPQKRENPTDISVGFWLYWSKGEKDLSPARFYAMIRRPKNSGVWKSNRPTGAQVAQWGASVSSPHL